MKKTIGFFRAALPAIFALALLVNFTEVKATDYINPVQLKFIGNMNNQPMFQLSFTADPSENDFVLSIKDEDGFILYREIIREPKFSKKFLLNTDEIGDRPLLFEVLNRKSNQVVVYKVDRYTKQVDEMLISKL